MQILKLARQSMLLPAVLTGLAFSNVAFAQSSNKVFLEEIIVTATKRTGGMDVQDVPIAITAYNDAQIDAMYLRDLKAIGYSAPSVQLEDIGTARGVANFSIRGLGINSSIPSIDPTVGVFVDGMYLGLNAGVVMDIFDLEGIEVLRGPQGVLFGRNVTGGAVLMQTTRPGDELAINARVASETGNNNYGSVVVSGPLSDKIGGKLAAYYNKDDGWFTNLFNGEDFGKAETMMYRGALDFEFTDTTNLIVRFEHADSDGDGPPAQNGGLYSTDSFDFSINYNGYYDTTWDQAIAEFTWDVGPGDGQIVNILGWREYSALSGGDIDSSPASFFHAPASTDQDQLSNELRYATSIGNSYLTMGIYYFTQDINYVEQRQLLGSIPPAAVTITGGGTQDQDTLAFFANLDIEATDYITFNIGARYTEEQKDGQVATILPGPNCTVGVGCTNYSFQESRTWNSLSPKIGVQIEVSEYTHTYAFWTKGFRSGGYNLRHTTPLIPSESFDQETQNSYEIGIKKDFAGGRVRVNMAGYYNTIGDMQREVNTPIFPAGVAQLIRNTADATITGFDFEMSASLSDNLFLRGSYGYVDGSYDEVRYDLNNDLVVDDADKNLAIPRLAPQSYGADLIYSRDTSLGTFTLQGSGYHRDASAYTDSNVGQLRAADMFDASMSMTFMEDRLKLSVFGRNLKNESTIGGDTQLPPNFPGGPASLIPTLVGTGATFSPLNKGRTYGVELQYRM